MRVKMGFLKEVIEDKPLFTVRAVLTVGV